jgi:hypothetical protein
MADAADTGQRDEEKPGDGTQAAIEVADAFTHLLHLFSQACEASLMNALGYKVAPFHSARQ